MSAHYRQFDVDRLAKLCGLLGSAHPGERAAAGLKATDLLQRAGVTWHELFDPLKPRELSGSRTTSHAIDAETCLRACDLFNEAELDFLRNIAGRRQLSPKQRAWLARLVDRAQ